MTSEEEHTPTPWFHRQAGEVSRSGDAYDWIADHPDAGMHRKIILLRGSCSPADCAFIVRAVNCHAELFEFAKWVADRGVPNNCMDIFKRARSVVSKADGASS